MLVARNRRYHLARQRQQARADAWLLANGAALRAALADTLAMEALLDTARALCAGRGQGGPHIGR